MEKFRKEVGMARSAKSKQIKKKVENKKVAKKKVAKKNLRVGQIEDLFRRLSSASDTDLLKSWASAAGVSLAGLAPPRASTAVTEVIRPPCWAIVCIVCCNWLNGTVKRRSAWRCWPMPNPSTTTENMRLSDWLVRPVATRMGEGSKSGRS